MSEFINEFGKENFIIMVVIVGIIVLALVLILIVERHNSKKIIKRELANIKNNVNGVRRTIVTKKDEVLPVVEEVPDNVDDGVKEEFLDVSNDSFDDYSDETVIDDKPIDDVYYAPTATTKKEAKEKLDEVTKRLIDEDSDLIDHTHFETEQEEKSIISYDELVKASHDIDEKNDRLLEDEEEVAISLEELYKKHEEEQNIIEDINKINEVKVNNPTFDDEPKKFKNSDVISPVFGVYSGKVKPKNVLKEINKTVGNKDLEDEIQRTEDFLTELKKLKNKLD